MKKALLVQGPLISPGFTPFFFDETGNYINEWVDYDAVANVCKIVDSALKFFDVIVISTWSGQSAQLLNTLQIWPENVFLEILNEDDFLKKKREEGTHKYHQVKSTLAGALILESLNCDLVAKIRTDQSLDLEVLSFAVSNHANKPSYSFGVPYLNIFEMDRLTDFYFVARTSILISTLKNYLVVQESFQDTHKDYFYNFSDFIFKSTDLKSKKYLKLLNKYPHFYNFLAWTKFFYPLSPKLYRSMVWRGIKVNHRVNSWIRYFRTINVPNDYFLPMQLFWNLSLISLTRLFRLILMKPVSYIFFKANSLRLFVD